MTEMERVLALKTLPLFADLDPEQLDAVASKARLSDYAAGERIRVSPRRARRLSIVIAGRVRARLVDGSEAIYERHQVLGGAAALARPELLQAAEAAEASTCLVLGYDHMEELVFDSFSLAHAMIRGAARSVRRERRALPVTKTRRRHRREAFRSQLVERVALMSATRSLGALSVRVLSELAREAKPVRLSAGENLWREGDTARHAFVLRSGQIEVGADDRYVVHAPAVVGSVDALAEERRRWSATMIRSGDGLRLEARSFLDVLEDDSHAALETLRLLSTAAMHVSSRPL